MMTLTERHLDVALIQEPWLVNGQIQGLGIRGYKTFYANTNGKPRACIVARESLNFSLVNNYSNGDLAVIRKSHGRQCLLLAAAYLPYEEEDPPSEEIRKITIYAKNGGFNLVMGCDANAHHTQWGSKNINKRGEYLFDFILNSNLLLCNRGNNSTFRNSIREEVLDITLATNTNTLRVNDWKVSAECSFSDHSRIFFNIDSSINKVIPFRNARKANWVLFSKRVDERMETLPARNTILKPIEIENRVNKIGKILTESFKASCPISRPNNKANCWFNGRLSEIRSKTRKLWRKAIKENNEISWSEYRNTFNIYKKELRQAQGESWQNYCNSIMETQEAARLRKKYCRRIKLYEDAWKSLTNPGQNQMMMP